MKHKRGTRMAFVLGAALAGACGARTELEGIETDASLDAEPDALDAKHEHDAAEEDAIVDVVFPDVPIVSDCPDAGATLVYLLGAQNQLFSFYPPTLGFTNIGTIACQSKSSPNSMAVTRSGIAFAGFLDGTLFEVSTANAACKATTYHPDQDNFSTFGMGYAGNADGGETLYVAGNATDGGSQGLAAIDTTLFQLDFIAQFQPLQPNCELSGTGGGQLYGFCPLAHASVVNQIDTATAQITSSHQLLVGAGAQAFAFAFWGGDFWIFTSGAGNSTITEYDPVAQTETNVGTAPLQIVGAGVSTCAPQ
jgi:hypothetical protein